MSDAIAHRHTPTLQVCDPSGAPVRSVAYYRRTAQEHAKPRVTASASRRAGRVSQQWDPRLFALNPTPTADIANLTGLTSLSGRPLLTESVDAGWRVQFWGAAGELQVGWDGRGTRTRHSYDAIQRPIAVFEQRQDAPECCIGLTIYGTQAAASVALNQCGQPVRVDDSAGSRQVHGYSLQGAPLAETRQFLQALAEPDWPQAVAQRDELLEPEGATTRWGYDALGALLQQTDAQGNRQYTDYNIAGQIAGTRLQLRGQVEQTLIRDITYNAFGQITAETAGNGVTTRATYRADTGVLLALRAQRADKTWLQDLRYAYDPVGNVLSITDATQSVRHFANARIVPVNNYAYDTLSQLIRATGREVGSSGYGPELRVSADPTQLVNYTQTYHYDTAGNLHTLQHLGAQSYTRKMQAAEHSNRSLARKVDDPLLNAGEFSAGFDANGNVQHLQPGQVLLWDGRNQLCQVTPVARDEGADDTERYVYDGGGQRLRKVRISQARNVAHTAQVRYLPGLEIREDSTTGEILHVITVQSPGRSSVRVLHWVTDTPIGVSNNQLRYGLGDHLGSSSLELDSEAQLVSQEGYYPYGGTAWWAASNRTEVKYKTLRYSGKERDATGLYYYGFRYYAPCWGRWLNPDPAGTVDGLNLYCMVSNNPVRFTDSQGLVREDLINPSIVLDYYTSFSERTYSITNAPAELQLKKTEWQATYPKRTLNKKEIDTINASNPMFQKFSKNKLSHYVAHSAGTTIDGSFATSEHFNFPEQLGSALYPGVVKYSNRFPLKNNSEDLGIFEIKEPAKYMAELKNDYAPSQDFVFNDKLENLIKDHLGRSGLMFPVQSGTPGRHAEVRTLNAFLNNPISATIPLENFYIMTQRLVVKTPSATDFVTCFNCNAVIPWDVKIPTGRLLQVDYLAHQDSMKSLRKKCA